MQLRPYQIETIDALHGHICSKQTNPCIVLPTGSGKSVVMAAVIRKWHEESPWVRGCVLAHRKELVHQNSEKMRAMYPEGDIGIFSAGLKQRDYSSSLLFASIDSIFKRSGEFTPFDFLFVDEAHRIPPRGEGKYRTFINGCRKWNKDLRVIGWTATPYRMGCGPICHKDHILHEICYEASITALIRDKFLCNLRSKVGECQPNLKSVARNSNGDYKLNALGKAVNQKALVTSAVAEAMRIADAKSRNSIAFFCVDIEHCKQVSAELRRHGVYAPFLTGKTKQADRDSLLRDFKLGRIRAVCSVGVLTEGFDSPRIDCIVLLRPTLSAGLFSQMVGRGLRPSSNKEYCLTLDFAGCIEEHGPIDILDGGRTVMAVCTKCRESFSRAIRVCPVCGWEIPAQEIERLEAEAKVRRMHGTKASKKSILSKPEVRAVDSVYVNRHIKDGSPDSLRVQYRCGLSIFQEWICLDHEGYAGLSGATWWKKRFGAKAVPTINEALEDLFLSQSILGWTKTITVKKSGRYFEIIDYNQPMEDSDADN